MGKSHALEIIIGEFGKFPGIGQKTAERLAYFLIFKEPEFTRELTDNLWKARNAILFCSTCGNIGETDPCDICSNPHRDHQVICVVETPRDIIAIEKSAVYHGIYHVLGGTLTPTEGIMPEKLNLNGLLSRITPEIREIIIATSSNIPGEMTALYLKKLLLRFPVRITRIARGLPFGSDLEYTDQMTIKNAFLGRRSVDDESAQ
ncbi:MAG: recombination protein RecR [Candidatus Delongbacteria bacterium]|nr:recombination protein RecR [Candidatus Delongbacteria bacterium]